MADRLILNRYRQIETKGKGAFGTVDVAWDTRLQRRVAIKRIPLSIDETDLPGIHEARTAAMLNDSHIVTVLDFQVTGTEALIIMEYVDGPTLSTLLRESEELLNLDVIAAIVSDIAGALEYAHENQVLHLDIKPDNILIDHQGNIKVSDFGLSQLSGIAGFAEPQGGTIGYMPPEQLLQQGVDERTDLWALAVLLYLLLTGENPFNARSIFESLDNIIAMPLRLPSEFRLDLSPEADEIIVRALMADKWQRYDSVSEFLSQIAEYLGSVQAGRKGLKYRVNERDLDELVKSDAWHQEDEADYDDRDDYDDYDDGADDEDREPGPPLWERLSRRFRNTLGRLVAAVACGSFASAGLSGFDLFNYHTLQSNIGLLILLCIIGLIALGAFLVPRLGSALACVVFIAGLFARGLVPVAIVVALLLIAWWLFYGRRGVADATVVMLTPLLGAFWLSFALPLLTGYFLRPKRALVAAIAQGLLLIVIASITGSASLTGTTLIIPEQKGMLPSSMLAFLSTPTPWILFVAFVLAALVASFFSSRSDRWLALLGTTLATAILALGCVASLLLTSGLSIQPQDLTHDGAVLALSFILLLVLTLLGVPASKHHIEEV